MTEKSFDQQVSEIITPALEKFKTYSPARQQKYLAWLDKFITDQPDEFCKDVSLRVRKLFADHAHQLETMNQQTAD